jgi:outer membrane protein assembly factor BamB
MDGFEIVVGSGRGDEASGGRGRGGGGVLRVASAGRVLGEPGGRVFEVPAPEPSRPAREALDLFVGGVNVTARVAPDQAPCVVRDLAMAVVDLALGVRRRAVVRFYDAPWEIGLERAQDGVVIDVVRNGPEVEIAVHDRRVALHEVVLGTRAAIDRMLDDPRPLDAVLVAELAGARDALGRIDAEGATCVAATEEVLAVAEPEGGLRVAFGAEMSMRACVAANESAANEGVDRASETSDLHALLGRGRLRAVVRGRTKELGEVHAFLVAERLVELGVKVLDAWERGRALHLRAPLDPSRSEKGESPLVGVRMEQDGALSLTIVPLTPEGERASPSVFPSLEGTDLVDAVVSLGRMLVRAVVRRDRAQASNLRLSALRRRVRELSDRLRDVARPVGPFGESDLVNPRRESYRPYVQVSASALAQQASSASGPSSVPLGVRRLKYEPRWMAEVPGIDLRATFLCGDRLVLSGNTQSACVDRVDGRTIWKLPTVRATSLPTPGGLARLRGDGRLELRDFGDGAVVWSRPCATRSRGTPAACTIVAPGLPRLLVATDGDRHLVAFDLTSGEPRWRHALVRPGPIRIRRAGRLLVVSSDESQLVALDAVDGRVVWRVRDRLRFSAPAAIEREELIAVAGEPSGTARLHCIDALSGARRWERVLEAAVATDCAPMLFASSMVVVTRDRRGLGLLALDRATGVERWHAAPGAWPTGTCAMAVDGTVVLNGPMNEVLALRADTGATVWRHVFDPPFHGDAPRRMEPVLRGGALFVPQDKVRVLRPHDGAIVGEVPTDLVPDLLRVDERCDVYVAEESGHVIAFGATARLAVVK